MTPTDPSPTLSHPPATLPKTYLDVLPTELINGILVHLAKHEITRFHDAWPGSRYALLSEPLLYAMIAFDGRKDSLAQLLAGFAARPETRFWARQLVAVGDEWPCKEDDEWGDIKNMELLSIQRALTRILPPAEAEIITAPSFLIRHPPPAWERAPFELVTADRVRVLACLLPNVTRIDLGLHGLHEWEVSAPAYTTYDWVGRESALPDVGPILGEVRDVLVAYCGAKRDSQAVRPGELLWAFFLPKVRKVHGRIVRSAFPREYMRDRALPVEDARWAMHGASGVEVLHLTDAALGEAALEGLLRLPSKLRDFFLSFNLPQELAGYDVPMFNVSVCALARGLAAQAGSLERVRVREWPYQNQGVRSERLGSLRGMTKLRELEVEFWMLAGPGCQAGQAVAQSVEDATVGLSGLPPGLVRLRLITRCTICEGLCEIVWGHLRRLFESKREWAPMLKTLELVVLGVERSLRGQWGMKKLEEELREMAESMGANLRLKVMPC